MTILTVFSKEVDVTTAISYAIAWNIARSKRPYIDGEFTRKKYLQIASTLDPGNKKLLRLSSQMTFSKQTIVRGI